MAVLVALLEAESLDALRKAMEVGAVAAFVEGSESEQLTRWVGERTPDGWTVICPGGTPHAFATEREADHWAEWGHPCLALSEHRIVRTDGIEYVRIDRDGNVAVAA